MDLSIIPECFVDTNLIETLAPPQGKGYNHQKGCGTVTKVMQESFSNSFALGIIDKDKKEVDYLKEFSTVKESESLILHKHKQRDHYIIQISPAIEQFIIANAEAAGISLEDYGLPAELNPLKRDSKRAQSKKDLKFKNLFKAIRKSGSEDFQKLGEWVIYLRDNPYNVNFDDLK